MLHESIVVSHNFVLLCTCRCTLHRKKGLRRDSTSIRLKSLQSKPIRCTSSAACKGNASTASRAVGCNRGSSAESLKWVGRSTPERTRPASISCVLSRSTCTMRKLSTCLRQRQNVRNFDSGILFIGRSWTALEAMGYRSSVTEDTARYRQACSMICSLNIYIYIY